MNRIMVFLCFLCIPWAARGQSAYEWRYWFDTDQEQQTGQATSVSFSVDVDASALSEGPHTIHWQIADDEGRYSPPQSRLFYRVADLTVKRLRYWFDSDPGIIHLANIEGAGAMIDVTTLEPGVHFIFCQAEDALGNVSDIVSRVFYRPMRTNVATWSYWFDGDSKSRQTTDLPDGPVMVDVSGLSDGFHTIYSQVSEKVPSAVTTRIFIKIPQTEGAADMTCICTVDEKIIAQKRVPAAGGIINWDMDVNKLPVGLHRAVFQVITESGVASTLAERFFVRTITSAELGSMKCVYTLDNSSTQSLAGSMANGLFHFDLDVSSMEDGLHRIAYMMVSEDGITTPQQTAFFWKTPVGGAGIVQYDYWLNDEEQDMKSFHLDKRENPFKLISLLPVDAQPIRSECFQFEVRDGQPMLYAKNDFHIRFFDTDGRALSETRQYVDYQVGQEVELVGELQATQTFDRPAEGSIRWYWLEAEKGDLLEFKADRACTMQLFSPSAKEVLNVSGSASVAFNGTHADESGRYYLALHDVTAANGTDITLSYNKLDKFVVLSHTVTEMGVLPGVQLMGVSGNGLDCVTSVALVKDNNKIVADTIIADNKAEAHVLFVFNGAEEFGNYDLIFHFDNGESAKDITVKYAVTLSEPHFGDIDIAITDPRSVASPYPVTIKVTNTSNLTYSHIPFYMAYDHVERINDMRLLNFDIEADKLLVDSGLVFIHDVEDFKQKGISARMIPAVIPTLMPGETQIYRLGFKAANNATYNVYAWTGTPWNLYANETMTAIQALAQSGSGFSGGTGGGSGCSGSGSGGNGSVGTGGGSGGTGSGGASAAIILPGGGSGGAGANVSGGVATSCMPDPCGYAGVVRTWIEECTCATALGLGQVLGGIYNALHNRSNRAQREQLAASGLFDNPYDDFPDYYLPNPNDIFNNWLGHCIPYPGALGKVMSGLNAFQNTFGGDPCPDPDPHGCNQWNPGDPNDIYGYLSEAGSKFIADSVEKINYTIEFENDTTLANASAHTITIRDTLNVDYLELKSFVPTALKLGRHEVALNDADVITQSSVTSFLKTIDMRPEINAIAQVEGTYSQQTGIAEWRFTSLDPMTMEPTDDLMQGILPVNYNGTSGIGEVMFQVGVKPNKGHGTEIKNRASIVFDYEEAILTPMWVNTVDARRPVSRVVDATVLNDSTATVSIDATDDGSGPWRYNVYVQYGEGSAWFLAAENVPADSTANVKVYEGIDHGFYVVCTDMAGNVEQKEPAREFALKMGELMAKGDINGDGKVDVSDYIGIANRILGQTPAGFNEQAADVNGDGVIDVSDYIGVANIILTGNIHGK